MSVVNGIVENTDNVFGREYDCEAEKSAYESAKKCSDSAFHQRNRMKTSKLSKTQAISAILSWAREALNLNVTEEEEVLYRSNQNVSNFANLAWDTREKVGCAVSECPSGNNNATTIHVVCHYPKIDKEEGKPIYSIGEQCDRCSEYLKYGDNITPADSVFCHVDDGVCVTGLQNLDDYFSKEFYPFPEL
ncbi:SCP-like protein [Ancylostoma duodenale]|uniref:SCP-like protein n=1 Tax=Ancylostoma duodenale TaxID=51022 RepID=A0A0C2FSJ5_9BILA|nr:SCP-like protein [Ancylostoma duodenale]